MRLTAHFLDTEIGAPPELYAHAVLLACALEEVRAVVEAAVIVVRGWSSPEHNASVGGVATSYHPLALAADVHVYGRTDAAAMQTLATQTDRMPLVRRLVWDQRPGHQHIHIEARHPERDDGAPLQCEIETAAGFRRWRIS